MWHSSRLKEHYNDLILTYLEISNTSIMIYARDAKLNLGRIMENTSRARSDFRYT
jgi:hypothetical protein